MDKDTFSAAATAKEVPATPAVASTSPEQVQGPVEGPVEAEFPHVEEAVDAEEHFDDGDSALGESTSVYTTSLASSVLDYPVEYGRRYHAYQAGRYTRPNDELEMDRLLIFHTLVTLATGGLFLAPLDPDKSHRILDIGTGNGVWAIEMADRFPNSLIIGNDLSANMPTFIPPNVKFEVDDVEISISDWPLLVQRAYENLEPGGWAEFQDFDLIYYSEDGSLKLDDPLYVWIKSMNDSVRNMGRDPQPGHQLQKWFENAGFTNVFHRRYKFPIGPWAKDPHMKEVGMHNFMQINQGLEGLSLRLYMNVLKWTHEQAMVMLTEVRRRLHDPSIHAIIDFHVVYGQKAQ